MRTPYHIVIDRADGSRQDIRMVCTSWQATKAVTAMGYALMRSDVERLTLYCGDPEKWQSVYQRLDFGLTETEEKALRETLRQNTRRLSKASFY